MHHRIRIGLNVLFALTQPFASFVPPFFGGAEVGDISNRYPTYVVPAGYAFSIWSVIFALCLAYAVWQALPAQRQDERLRRIGWATASAMAATTTWPLVFQSGLFTLSVVVIVWALVSLAVVVARLGGLEARSRAESWLTHTAFGIFFGWVLVATIANVAQTLRAADVRTLLQLNGEIWGVILMITAGSIAAVLVRRTGNLGMAAAVCWALVAVVFARLDTTLPTRSPAVAVAALAAAVMVAGAAVLARQRPRGASRGVRTALILLLAGGALSITAEPVHAQRGHLQIVGGGRQPDALVARFVELAGGPGRAHIAVVPMASGVAQESGDGKVEQLVEFGASAFNLNLTREQAMGDSAVALLANVTGVWFTGGDQARLVAVLEDSPVLAAIRARYREGAVLAGTSAGAAIMSDSMLTGNQILAGEDTIGYHGDEFRRIARSTIDVVAGFGFLPGTIIDQHFIERERHNRLLSVVLERPSLIGAGIAEGTAIEVAPDGTWRIDGRGAVIVYDAREAGVTLPHAEVLGASGIRMHVLPRGATFDPVTGTARLPDAPWRARVGAAQRARQRPGAGEQTTK